MANFMLTAILRLSVELCRCAIRTRAPRRRGRALGLEASDGGEDMGEVGRKERDEAMAMKEEKKEKRNEQEKKERKR